MRKRKEEKERRKIDEGSGVECGVVELNRSGFNHLTGN